VVAETETVAQTIDLFRTTRPNVITLDVGLRSATGMDALSVFRTITIDVLGEGALECIVEPFDSPGLERMWRRLSEIYPELKRSDEAASGR